FRCGPFGRMAERVRVTKACMAYQLATADSRPDRHRSKASIFLDRPPRISRWRSEILSCVNSSIHSTASFAVGLFFGVSPFLIPSRDARYAVSFARPAPALGRDGRGRRRGQSVRSVQL